MASSSSSSSSVSDAVVSNASAAASEERAGSDARGVLEVDEVTIRAALRAVNVPSVRADASKAVAKPESDRMNGAGLSFEGNGVAESADWRMSSFDFERARSYRRCAESSLASIWHQEFERRS